MALLCYEAQEQHDPEYTDNIAEALKGLQQQLNVSTNCSYFVSVALLGSNPDCLVLGLVENYNTINNESLPSTTTLFHLCRSETGTWFVCGRWLENAWLNMPPPGAPGPTPRGFAGLFREELRVSWSTATTRSLIFPPYQSRLVNPGGTNGWPSMQGKMSTVPELSFPSNWMQLLGNILAVWLPTYSSSYFPYRSSS